MEVKLRDLVKIPTGETGKIVGLLGSRRLLIDLPGGRIILDRSAVEALDA